MTNTTGPNNAAVSELPEKVHAIARRLVPIVEAIEKTKKPDIIDVLDEALEFQPLDAKLIRQVVEKESLSREEIDKIPKAFDRIVTLAIKILPPDSAARKAAQGLLDEAEIGLKHWAPEEPDSKPFVKLKNRNLRVDFPGRPSRKGGSNTENKR